MFPLDPIVRLVLRGLATLLIILALSKGSEASQRTALIIANSDYDHLARLKNPTRDADLIAATLTKVGFATQVETNRNRADLWRAISDFATSDVIGASEVVMLYLAGHGAQIKGQSYFLPTDVRSRSEEDFEMEGLSLRGIVEYLTAKGGSRTYIFVIDACREIIIRREGRGELTLRGLARMNAPPETFIAYSTSPGEVALDGRDASPFAAALAQSIPVAGRAIEETFRDVRRKVYQSTAKKQITWDESALFEPFHFVPGSMVQRGADAANSPLSGVDPSFQDRVLEEMARLRRTIEELKEKKQENERELLNRGDDKSRAKGEQELRRQDRNLQEAQLRLHRNQVALNQLWQSPASKFATDTRTPKFASLQVAYEQGVGAYKAGYFNLAISALEAYREGSSLRSTPEDTTDRRLYANYYLARIYSDNSGAVTDHAKAYALFQQIADDGLDADPDSDRGAFVGTALAALGNYLRVGIKEIALEPNRERSITYLQHAATFYGSKDAQLELAKTYLADGGNEDDVKRGKHYLAALAEEGHAAAQAMLADMYWRGRHVPRDEQRALALLTMAVENAPARERVWIEDVFQNVFCGSTPATRTQADGLVANWRRGLKRPSTLASANEPARAGSQELNIQRFCKDGEPVLSVQRAEPGVVVGVRTPETEAALSRAMDIRGMR